MQEKKPSQAGRILLTVLLCVVLFFSAIAAVLVAEAHQLTSKGTLQSLLNQVLVGSARPRLPHAGSLSAGLPAGILEGEMPSGGLLTDLLDEYYDQIKDQFGITLSKEDLGNLLSSSTIPGYLSDKVSSIVTDVINGTHETQITQSEINDLIDENRQTIEGLIGGPIPQESIDAVMGWVDENGGDMVTRVQDIVAEAVGIDESGNLSENNPLALALQAVGTFASLQSVIFAGVICLVISVLIMLVNFRALPYGLRSNGITYLVAGLLSLLPYAGGTAALSLLPPFLANLLGVVLQVVLKPAGTVAIVGTALLILGIIWGALSKPKAEPQYPSVEF